MKGSLRFAANLLLVGLTSAIVIQSAQAQSSGTQQKLTKRVVADYVSAAQFITPPYNASKIPYHKLTHIIHASVPWGADGSLSVPNGFIEPALFKKAHAAGVKVMLLTGGDFAAIEDNPTMLNTVVSNLQAFVTAHGYDGLDVDWEFPQTPLERTTMVKLMTALRATFPSPAYTLSIDVAPWLLYGYNFDKLKTVIDFFNIMVYDCAGPWTAHAQLNSPIFWDWHDHAPRECQPGASDEEAITLMSKHMPLEQINLGTPFYGYDYTNVTAPFQECPNAPYTPDGACDDAVTTWVYKNLKPLINQQGWKTSYDPIALVPYMLRTDGSPGFITYDDAFSTYARVYYADWTRGVGGTFMWALDQDYVDNSQDLLDAMYHASLQPK